MIYPSVNKRSLDLSKLILWNRMNSKRNAEAFTIEQLQKGHNSRVSQIEFSHLDLPQLGKIIRHPTYIDNFEKLLVDKSLTERLMSIKSRQPATLNKITKAKVPKLYGQPLLTIQNLIEENQKLEKRITNSKSVYTSESSPQQLIRTRNQNSVPHMRNIFSKYDVHFPIPQMQPLIRKKKRFFEEIIKIEKA